MNWDAVGAVGEIIGALAVVLSVIYLATQIRKQTDESRLVATRELSTQYQANLRILATDAELAEIWLRGVRDYTSLPDIERLRISAIFYDVFRSFEQQYLHSVNAHLEGSFFESTSRVFGEFLAFPGVQQWWEVSTHAFDDGFQKFVDAEISKVAGKSITSTFGGGQKDAT